MMIDKRYLVIVKELPAYLPYPRLRRPNRKEDRCETLDELEIIGVRCELNEV